MQETINSFNDFFNELKNNFNINQNSESLEATLENKILIPKNDLQRIVTKIKNFGFDMLRLISSVDYKDHFLIIYHFLSTTKNISMVVEVKLEKNDDNPSLDSLTPFYNSANWLEREVYDLMGIIFKGHPNLRRILLALDWEGYPLRKDYVMPNNYHGITKHDNNEQENLKNLNN